MHATRHQATHSQPKVVRQPRHQIPQDTSVHWVWYNHTTHPYLAHRLTQGGPRWKKCVRPHHKHHQGFRGQGLLQPFLALFCTILLILVLGSIFRIARAVKKILEPPQKLEAKRGQSRHQKRPENVEVLMVNEENQGILVQVPSVSDFDRDPI